ncbi:MAG TPA: lysylphosphatidylglycerol synthase transmembrane domain-containing protein [Streptosporangiales bacterium]
MARRWSVVARALLAAGGVGYLAWKVPADLRSAAPSLGGVPPVRWGWLAAAVLLAVASLAAYGEMHRRLLSAGGRHVPAVPVQEMTFAQNAVSQTVPAVGGPLSAGYAVSQLRRLGIDTALATWVVVLAGALTIATFVPLGLAALAWAGLLPVPVVAVVELLAIGAITAAGALLTRPRVLRRGVGVLAAAVAHVPSARRMAWTGDPGGAAERVATRLSGVRPSGRQWAVLLGLAAGTWILDFLTLAAGFTVFATQLPWTALAVGYLIVQVSIAVQITPGGAGLADAGLFGALVAFGVAPGAAAGAALTYRGIAWLGMAVLGWVAYGRRALRRRQPATVTALPTARKEESRAA